MFIAKSVVWFSLIPKGLYVFNNVFTYNPFGIGAFLLVFGYKHIIPSGFLNTLNSYVLLQIKYFSCAPNAFAHPLLPEYRGSWKSAVR
jgi:hypothetical protein